MRTSKAEKAVSRARILEAASRLFRARGVEGTAVSDVMEAAGLTHGGFYRHFASKDELVAAAIDAAVEKFAATLQAEIEQFGTEKAVTRFAERYLSREHVAMRENGCPLAALASEAGRGPSVYGDAITRGAKRMTSLLANGLGPKDAAHGRAAALFAQLIGAVVLARAAGSSADADKFLAAGRVSARASLRSG